MQGTGPSWRTSLICTDTSCWVRSSTEQNVRSIHCRKMVWLSLRHHISYKPCTTDSTVCLSFPSSPSASSVERTRTHADARLSARQRVSLPSHDHKVSSWRDFWGFVACILAAVSPIFLTLLVEFGSDQGAGRLLAGFDFLRLLGN